MAGRWPLEAKRLGKDFSPPSVTRAEGRAPAASHSRIAFAKSHLRLRGRWPPAPMFSELFLLAHMWVELPCICNE